MNVLQRFREEEPGLFEHIKVCDMPFCTKVRKVLIEVERELYPR